MVSPYIGEDMIPLKPNECRSSSRVAKFLGIPDLAVLTQDEDDDGLLEIFQEFFQKWVAPRTRRAHVEGVSGRLAQTENQISFRAVERALKADDEWLRRYRKRKPKLETTIDGYAFAIWWIVLELDSLLYYRFYGHDRFSLHAKRCMAWVLLQHMIYKENFARKTVLFVEAGIERKRKVRDEEQSFEKARKRRKGNDGVVIESIEDEDSTDDDHETCIAKEAPEPINLLLVDLPIRVLPPGTEKWKRP